MPMHSKPALRGLESVVAAVTAISFVDGTNGRLYYRGYDLNELAGRVCFEEVVHLLWTGDLPTAAQLSRLRDELSGEMRLPSAVYDLLRHAPPSANPMVVLRTAVSALGLYDPDGGNNDRAANARKATRLLAQVATIVSAHHRLRTGQAPLSADRGLSFADNFLYMFLGEPPDAEASAVFDRLLVLHADHGLAASTFTARVTTSTLAGAHSALTAALAALKGPLHGGANVAVMDMLDEIGSSERLEAYIDGLLAQGRRVMGFGHRVYKVEDPRSRHLRSASEQLCRKAGLEHLYEMSQHIERLVFERKGIYPNVDFYSATVQTGLGIPKRYFTAIFALARTAGWMAHIQEQHADNRLIRPTSSYVGGYHRTFVPLAERKTSPSEPSGR